VVSTSTDPYRRVSRTNGNKDVLTSSQSPSVAFDQIITHLEEMRPSRSIRTQPSAPTTSTQQSSQRYPITEFSSNHDNHANERRVSTTTHHHRDRSMHHRTTTPPVAVEPTISNPPNRTSSRNGNVSAAKQQPSRRSNVPGGPSSSSSSLVVNTESAPGHRGIPLAVAMGVNSTTTYSSLSSRTTTEPSGRMYNHSSVRR
jgi:hypothetical protein